MGVVFDHEVLIVGGGQAGLAMAYFLQRSKIGFVVLDAGTAVGHVWRSRWDSLKLFTPAQYANLPGLAFPARRDTYPGRDQVADYLADYARHFELPVRLNTKVVRLRSNEGGGFVASTSDGEVRARQVVVATGPFSRPFIPAVGAGPGPDVVQFHTADYRNPGQVPDGSVLVVGGGNSGFQIAAELAEAGRVVTLSEGRQNACIPQRPLGRDIFWWQTRLGLLQLTAESSFGRRMKDNDGTVIGSSRGRLRRRGVRFRSRFTRADGRMAGFADGTTTAVDSVVWATGFVIDDSWVEVPGVLDGRNQLVQERGVVTGTAGLYTVGRAWQHTTGSALLGFVRQDAEWLSERIVAGTSRR